MKKKSWFGLGFGIASLAMLMQIPAALVAGAVTSACEERCRLAQARGTVWSGAADLYLRPFERSPWQDVGRLDWSLENRGIGIRLGQGRLLILPAKDGIHLQANSISLPAEILLPLLPNAPQAGWNGRMEIVDLQARLGFDGTWDGAGGLYWFNAQTALLPNVALGDYRLQGRGSSDGGGKLQVSTERGQALALAGEATATSGADSQWRFSGTAEILSARTVLEPLLRTVGQPIGGSDGRYRIEG